MSRRTRNHKKIFGGLNRYSLWILVSIVMGRKVVPSNKKRITSMVNKDGVESQIQSNAIDVLKSKNYIFFNKDKKCYTVTNEGFNIAYDRLKMTGLTISSSGK